MTKEELQRLKQSLDNEMDSYLVEMKEGWDDSVVGFNVAWDVMREFFKRRIKKISSSS